MFDNHTDLELVQGVQEGINADACLQEIVNRHSGIYIEMVNYFMPQSMPFVNRTDLIDDKEYNIYRAVLKYDPDRGTKFSTHLGNETKWMCLNLYNKNKKYSQVEFDEKLKGILVSLDIRVEKDSVDFKRLRNHFIDLYLLRHEWMRELVDQTGKTDDQFRRDAEVKLGMPLFPNVSWMPEDAPKFPTNPEKLSETTTNEGNRDTSQRGSNKL